MELKLTLSETFGSFAANGTIGDLFRTDEIEPHWDTYSTIILDFQGISSMTDSFANAFIGNMAELHPEDFKTKLRFKNCSPLVKSFIKSALQFAQHRANA